MTFTARPSRLALLLLAAACSGSIAPRDDDEPGDGGRGGAPTAGRGGGGAGMGGNPGGAGGTGGAVIPPPPAEVGVDPLRRLTRAEYDNVIGDLLGIGLRPAGKFTADIAGSSGFSTAGLVTEIEVGQFQVAAEQAATEAMKNIGKLTPCDLAARGERGCAEDFVRAFGKRAYRRPLADDEVTMHLALYDKLRAENTLTHPEAQQVLIAAYLQSPAFLYHWERGPAPAARWGGRVPLGSWEIASKLSFYLWQSMPDPELFAAAEAGALTNPAEVEKHARRLLASQRADRVIDRFHREWLHLANAWPKNNTLYPLWTGGTDIAAVNDVINSLRAVLRSGDGTFGTLLSTRQAFVSEQLAKVYGLTGVTGQNQPVTLDAATRPGILTRLGILAMGANANDADPTKRGALIRTQLLCQVLTAPPANIPPLPVDAKLGIRARHEEHMTNPGCAECHKLTDGIGFGFDAYDGVGAFRTADITTGMPPKTDGVLVDVDGMDRTFNGPAELTNLLVGSDEARRCMAKQWVRFAFGRDVEEADEASMNAIYDSFVAAKYDIRELLVALTTSKSFLSRAPVAGETFAP